MAFRPSAWRVVNLGWWASGSRADFLRRRTECSGQSLARSLRGQPGDETTKRRAPTCFDPSHRVRDCMLSGQLLPSLIKAGRGLCSLVFPGLPAAMGWETGKEGAGVLLTGCAGLAGCGTLAHPAPWNGVMGWVDGLELGPHCKRSTASMETQTPCMLSVYVVYVSESIETDLVQFCTTQWPRHRPHLPRGNPL